MDNILISSYYDRPIVRSRNKVTLAEWAAYIGTAPIPSPADDDWVRQRVVAENIPLNVDITVNQTLTYFVQDPAVVSNINQFISSDNDTATEQALSASNQDVCGTFMPRYAMAIVSQAQIDTWRQKNNSPAPGPAPGGVKK